MAKLSSLKADEMPGRRESAWLDVAMVSELLNIKRCTIYAWAAQGRIPHVRIHGLIRFHRAEIEQWLASFRERPTTSASQAARTRPVDIAAVIARAKRGAYNPAHGETRRGSSPIGKEARDGAV
jgi:excisionase family DNA binding protein